MAGRIVSRSNHFALHRRALDVPARPEASTAPAAHASPFPMADLWIGALVPKRWARRAVTRNAIRRQIYSVCAAFERELPPAAHVVRLRTGFDRSRFPSASSAALKAAVRAELQALFAGAAAGTP